MIPTLARLTEALRDRYRIERELGAGGMATVYLAHDLRHERDVAIKVLHPDLGAALGGERFLSEIRTTAKLQHPHILPLLDSGEADGLLYYVMPLVTGETLRARLERERQLPIDDAVLIAREVADALGYAHGLGVIHRDIKPENILLQGGHALVADFGIALAVQTAGGARMTQTGLSLGTPQYMSPEQAMGEKQIDARSDIYALGAVTYEMLVGEAPFTGPSVQAIVARLITESPRGLAAQRKAVPEHVEAAVLHALEKLPADRFATAAEFSLALANRSYATTAVGTRQQAPHLHRRWSAGAITGWTVAVAAIGFAAWTSRQAPDTPASRFVVGFPQGEALDIASDGMHLAVSRDGSVLVYVGGDSSDTRLYLKRRDQLDAVAVPGTEGAYNPFFSPDGLELAFLSERGGRALHRVALAGGLPSVVYRGWLGTSGGSWGTDGFIYVDTDLGGVQRFRPDGGGRETVMALDTLNQETGFAWPEVLPGDKIIVARVRRAGDDPEAFDIVAGRIGSNERVTVTRAVSARYIRGHLLFVTADGTLQAARFDESRLALAGPPVVVATGVRVAGTFAGVDLAVDREGGLHYVAGPAGLTSQLEWVDGRGVSVPVDSGWQMSGFVWGFALSPDGTRIAVSRAGGGTVGTNIWVKQVPGGFMKVAGPRAFDPSWSADGRWIYYASRAEAPDAVHRVRADGLGGDSVVMRAQRNLSGVVASRDGRWLVATASDTGAPSDIVALSVGSDTVSRPLIASSAAELAPVLSPDGRWLAYVSTASGRAEVYVRPFPVVDGGLTQVSLNGGYGPKWGNSGKALYFRELGAGALMVADVAAGPEFRRSSPRIAFRAPTGSGTMMGERYDLSVDDSRFLVLSRGSKQLTAQLVRIDNVLAVLRKRQAP